MTARRVVTGLAIVVVAVLGWLLLAPQQLGGPVAIVSTYGNSMLPTYTASDLVVVAKASEYDVGDVVAYRSDEIGAVVLHRIVDVDEDGYITQGDNNDWLDPDRPTDDELMGTARLRIPGVGRLLEVPAPVRAAMVAMLGALALFGGRQVARRRARRPTPETSSSQLLSYVRRRRTTGRPRASAAANDTGHGFAWVGWPLTTALVAGAVVALALAVAVAVFTRPATAAGNLDYTHRGTFTYTADVPTGAVYPEGEVATGDPIFLQLVDTLDVALTYELDGPGGAVEPSGQLWVELANGTGWTTRSPLSDREDGD
ncbi:MAG: signal peptidase I, partial [Ilumatobacteraceae bacterium]